MANKYQHRGETHWGKDANNLSAKDATDHKQLERADAAVSATGWSPEPGPTVWRLNKNLLKELKPNWENKAQGEAEVKRFNNNNKQ